MLNYALTMLEKGKINKLVYCPANSYVKDAMEVGTLPGNLLDKHESLLGPLIDLIGKVRVQELVAKEAIEILPVAVARGRSFTKSILYCSEAQNLSEDHMILLISRIGEESRFFIDGDFQGQVDKLIFEHKNGIKLLNELAYTKDNHLFGAVRLKTIERCAVAQLAKVLSDLRN